MPDSYFSRTPKIRSHGEMEALLEKRAGGLVGRSGRKDSAQLAPPALEWLPPVVGMEAIVTACGRYSVARSRVDGVVSYQAWLRLPTPRRLGEMQTTADAAKQIAGVHAQGG